VDQARRLRDGHPELDLRVVVDPTPDEVGGALRTARLAWDEVAPDATHHLVVQDDTVLCTGFREHLERAVAARPTEAVSLYTEWGSETSYAVRLAALTGSAWAEVVDDYVPTQALVLPADAARGFSQAPDHPGLHDDFVMRAYLASIGVPARVTVPNLAEDARLPSIVGHDYLGERASVCFPDDHLADIAWCDTPAAPTTVPAFSYAAGQPYSLVRADGPQQRWRRVLHPVMPRCGPGGAALLDLGRATVQRLPAKALEIGPWLLRGLWVTAYGLGLVTADLLDAAVVDPGAVERALARPTTRCALGTLPHGAFRFLVEDDLRAESGAELSSLVETGVRQGYQAGAATRDQYPIPSQELP
jgi:hypothetical protein